MAAPSSSPGADDAKLEVLKNTLYDDMQEHGDENQLFGQADLLELDVIPNDDLGLLMRVVQGLCNDYLLVSTSNGRGGLSWRWRSKDDAKKYRLLPSHEDVMVYTLIDEARSDGIWSRTLKAKLKMHESVLKQCIKRLESKGYIRDMKSVEHTNKKMYIRADLRPSDRATGGPWYTDNVLDEAFIGELEGIVFNFVKLKSSYSPRETAAGGCGRVPKKGVTGPGVRKRGAGEISDDTGAVVGASHQRPPHPLARKETFLPYPAGYARYPTIHEIARFISDVGITNNTTLSEDEVQQLVEVLVYDGLLEAVRVGSRHGYRATRIARQESVPRRRQGDGGVDAEEEVGAGEAAAAVAGAAEPAVNGMVEAPCGRCPVFELCGEGGPVSPSNCRYFQRWLGLD